MAWGIPEHLEFTPKLILRHDNGYVAVGVDGDLQKILPDGTLVGKACSSISDTNQRCSYSIGDFDCNLVRSRIVTSRMAAIDLRS